MDRRGAGRSRQRGGDRERGICSSRGDPAVIVLNAIRIRCMRPRTALRLARLGRARSAAARDSRAFGLLAFTFRRSRDRTMSGPPPAMRTVDNHLLVLSPRLSLTLALSQTYANFVTPPQDEAPPLRESGHLPRWQRGPLTLIHQRIVSELWRERSQPASPARDSQVRPRW